MRAGQRGRHATIDIGRILACLVLLVLTLLGAAAMLLPFVFQFPGVRARVDRAIVDAVKGETGLDVSLRIERPTWPPGVVVRDVVVASTDPAKPFAELREARVTLRPFALLSGTVVIDSVEVDGLSVDAEMREGEPIPTNLPLHLKPHPPVAKTTSIDPPFRVLSLTGAHVKATMQPKNGPPEASAPMADVTGVDLDIDATSEGATIIYSVRLLKAGGSLRTPRLALSPPPLDRFIRTKQEFSPHKVYDEDSICGLSLNVQVTDAPTAQIIELHRLELDAHLDGDEAFGTAPPCEETKVADEQVAHLRIERVETELAKSGEVQPKLRIGPAGKLHLRAPAMLAARYVALPVVSGWVAIDLDVAGEIDLREPLTGALRASASGRIEAHELRLDQYRIVGESLSGDISIKPPLVVTSKRLDVKYAEGLVALTDVELRAAPQPLAKKQLPLRATLAFKGLTFPGLIRELGVTKAAHVRWDLDEGGSKLISGYLSPLQLDGDVVTKTKNFELAVREVEGSNPGHIIGVHSPIDLSTHVVIRKDHLGFENIVTRFGNSSLNARVYLGFDERLEVDAKSEQLDLAQISPLVQFTMAGNAKLDWKVRGLFTDPVSEGKLSIGGFMFDGFELGDVETVTAKNRGEVIDVEQYHASLGDSAYDVPSMRIDLSAKGAGAPIYVDALASSKNFTLADFYAIFHLQNDPRWKDIQGHLGFDSRARFVVGGKDDPCGTGHLELDLTASVLAMDLWGERYAGGNADLSIHWFDIPAGGLGMDLDLRAATLKKKGGGTVVASGRITRGGQLAVHVSAGGLSLKALDAMPKTEIAVDGSLDAVADVSGSFDDMEVDADVNLSPIHISDRTLGRSHLHVVREPLPTIAPSPSPDAKGCYRNRKLPPFDLGRYLSDPVSGEFVVSGDLFGGSVKLSDFRVTDQTAKVARGKIEVRGLDLGPLALLRPQPAEEELSDKFQPKALPVTFEGEGSADIELDRFPLAEWWNAKGSISGLTLDIKNGDLGVATVAPTPTITFAPEGAKLDETTLTLTAGEASAKVIVAADIDRTQLDPVTKSPKLAARVSIPNLPLSRLEQYFPKIERAEGLAHATLSIAGTLASPTWDGELVVENGAMMVKGFGMPISGVNGKIELDPRTGLRIAKLHGEVGGGTIDVSGGAALRGFSLGDVDVKILAKDVHFKYGDGISTTFGGELRATWSPADAGQASVPARLEGVVDLDSFVYGRTVKIFDVNSFQAAQRTDVEAYDPARDALSFDVEIRSKRGFHVRNNLVDATMAVGGTGLHAVGTNQRYGLVGELDVIAGGVFKFGNHDFDIREGVMKFSDETKIDPSVDVVAITEYRRADIFRTGSSAAAEWRIKLHAYGPSSELKVELSSDPPLSQEDAILLLTIGMTRAEANALGNGSVAGGAGLDFLANVAGVDQTVKQAIPVIDDFRFGTAYSVKTGRTEPQVTIGKRLADALRASITSGIGERREVLGNIEWQLSRKLSLQGSYDNINDITSQGVGNVGLDLRYRLEFE